MTPKPKTIAELISLEVRPEERQRRKEKVKTLTAPLDCPEHAKPSRKYEVQLPAPDGTFYLPDFTILWNGERWFWEHWGLMEEEKYRNHRETKIRWYEKSFPGRLVETFESPTLSADADEEGSSGGSAFFS
jgi:hypothetical protein